MESKKQIKISLKMAILMIGIALLVILIIYLGLHMEIFNKKPYITTKTGQIDDWKFAKTQQRNGGTAGIMSSGSSFAPSMLKGATESVTTMDSATIGFSTGGAKDVNNFRENIENGYFPISTDITYNGLFYDYSFDTGNTNESSELFSPSYSCAISKDPISNKNEYYMTVGLNSNIKESDFQRKKLNLVVVLDISGSMSSGFNSYYYDNPMRINTEDSNKSKMQIANESVNILIDQLRGDDRFGMILFDDLAYLGKPISLVSETDMESIKEHILEVEAGGGTNFENGYTEATELFDEYLDVDTNEYENRIIVITDAMPNYGTTSKTGLLSYVEKNANNGIYTTFIGVGVDFNSELIENISDVKGANYYSVHSSTEFKERMGEQFEYMVTPLVFDLELNLTSEDYKISMVYGSDTTNIENGNIMKVNTLFPSKTTETGEVKGGVVLLKLIPIGSEKNGNLKLDVSYKDRTGKSYSNSQNVEFDDGQGEKYDNNGIRKAIVLTRYANALKNWILYERSEEERFIIMPSYGITDCPMTKDEVYILLGENERTSVRLTVSDEYKKVFKQIKDYIEEQNVYIEDKDLNQETKLLSKLVNF